ncbi:MAG: c-type cytochrome [Candidatus Rokubacteria bacterium]|nr:c-type cytochrome [Candidatus Rokubacteria bacterium]
MTGAARLAALLVLVLPLAAAADGPHRHAAPGAVAPATEPHPRSRRVTMEEMHRLGGVPRGWRFTLPAGDAARGRQLFADLECYTCHAVAGERFPESGRDPREAGPPLTGVGAHHPAEYLGESILDPNAVIVAGPGYTGPDGRSVMPSYADSLTVTQWLDLVAFLRTLTAGEDRAHPVVREVRVGDYRVRVLLGGHADAAPAGHGAAGRGPGGHTSAGHGAGGHGSPGHGAAAPGHGKPAAPAGHLMAFISDADTDEPVPYLSVTARLQGAGGTGLTVKLEPMLGADGFHYGADVTPPRDLRRITLVIGTPSVKVLGPRRFASPVQATIEWAPAR